MTDSVTVLTGGRLIDGTGNDPIDDSIILIKNNKIEKIGQAGTIDYPKSAEVFDIKGKTVMPGLIDAHVHFQGVRSLNNLKYALDHPYLRTARSVIDAWRLLDSGFTACREMQNIYSIYLREAIEEGSLIGPRISSCGKAITMTGGHLDEAHSIPIEWVTQYEFCRVADGPVECRKAVREQIRVGADFIKICTTGGVMSERDLPTVSQYSTKEITVICNEAKTLGKKVAAHAHGNQGIKNALNGGVATIEHGTCINDETIDLFLKNDAWYIPTFSTLEAVITNGGKAGIRKENLIKAKQVSNTHREGFLKAWKAGVNIGLGCDYFLSPLIKNGVMGSHARELELYVEMGLCPMEAIVCATKNNAKILDKEDYIGTLESNKLADLIIVSGDPLIDIKILSDKEKIDYIFKDGVNMPRLNW